MRWIFGMLLTGILLSGCSSYKLLNPNPEIIPRESIYVDITNKDDNFELKKDKKYFIKFPAINQENFYLVLRTPVSDKLSTYLTRQFDDGKPPIVRIENEAKANSNDEAYRLDQTVPTFFWVIDGVSEEVNLDLEYRYLPIWRYKFETKNAEFNQVLADNRFDRSLYQSLGSSKRAGDLDAAGLLNSYDSKNRALKAVDGELLEIESIFPSNIRNSDDPAYLDYVGFRDALRKELNEQKRYKTFLDVVNSERNSRNNPAAFVEKLPLYLSFFENGDQYPQNVVSEVQSLLGSRLNGAAIYMDNQLKGKRDISPVELPAKQLSELYQASNVRNDRGFTETATFVDRFNRDVAALESGNKEMSAIRSAIRNAGSWPDNNFYSNLQGKLRRLQNDLPRAGSYGRFNNYTSARMLSDEAAKLRREASMLDGSFGRATDIVARVNGMRSANDYRGIRQLLQQNRDLDFLIDQYAQLDQESLRQQGADITRLIEAKDYAGAEARIRALHLDRDFLDYESISREKDLKVKQAEDQLVAAIERESLTRMKAYAATNGDNLNVDQIYASEAFKPVHVLEFSAGGPNVVARNNKRIQDAMDAFKFNDFPSSAIKKLYQAFTGNINDKGIEKARAIIKHGEMYKGSDRQTKNLVAEINPVTAKWLTEPRTYRKLYVIPSNAQQSSNNQYVFRMNLRIPSDAKFPVFDVNIKLPRELANSAGQQSWYQSMTLNGKPLKNEGRFSITAPTSSNNYECQITPLQVNKEGNNILEVRFDYEAFKVLEVSVMAQRSIIKRD